MFLRELHLQGFKSFAQPTNLRFTRDLTAVVGPNGSGKSNIADAVRWVLGEQSAKLLRGKSSADVIFAGSDKKSRLGFAEVSMVIDNVDARMPVDYKEVVITRRVYRDGNSEYLLNRAPVRLADIAMLLAKSGFGQKAYSVIGQGMIEDVLVAPPSQRKDFFDEATGVRALQMKRDETQHKLDKTRANLAQAIALFAEITPRLKSLQRQVNRLQRREEIQRELLELQRGYYASQYRELQKELAGISAREAVLQRQKSEHDARLRQLENELGQFEHEQAASVAFVRLQQEYERVQQERRQLLHEKTVLQAQREVKARELGQEQLAWLERQRSQLEQSAERTEQALIAAQAEEQRVRGLVADQEKEYAGVADKAQALEQTLAKAQDALSRRASLSTRHVQDRLADFRLRLSDIFKAAAPVDEASWKSLLKQGQQVMAELQQFEKELDGYATPGDAQDVVAAQQQLSEILARKEKSGLALQELKMRAVAVTQELKTHERAVQESVQQLAGVVKELNLAAKAGNHVQREALLGKELDAVEKKIAGMDAQVRGLQKELDDFSSADEEKRKRVFALQRQMQEQQHNSQALQQQLSVASVERARCETRQEDIVREIGEEMGGQYVAEVEALAAGKVALATEDARPQIHRLKEQLLQIGGIDEAVLAEHEQVAERHTFLSGQIEDLEKGIADLEKGVAELDRNIRKQFRDAFTHIKKKFEEYFGILFDGGKATLYLEEAELVERDAEDSENGEDEEDGDLVGAGRDPSASGRARSASKVGKSQKVITGVGVRATPPGKKLEDVSALSGGERALTAIALICAIMANNPSPFVILDEVDAALDEANSERFAAIIGQLAHKTQFVCITHNRATMRGASVLYGVTMGEDGVSKLLSVSLGEAEKIE